MVLMTYWSRLGLELTNIQREDHRDHKNPFENAPSFGALIGQRRMAAEDKKLSEKGVGNIFQTMAGTCCSISSRISQNGGTCVIDTPRCLLDCEP